MKQASQDTRDRAIASWKDGTPISQICKSYRICRTTFYKWRKRDAAGEQQLPKPRGRPPKILSPEDLRNIQALIDNGENALSARGIGARLGHTCHLTVIWRTLKELGYSFKKSLIACERNRKIFLKLGNVGQSG